MKDLLDLLKFVGKDVPDGAITLLINAIVSKHKELPLKIHRDLKFNVAIFLVFYPLQDKQKNIYDKLIGDKAKLGYLLRYVIGQANKEKLDTSSHRIIKQEVRYNKNMFDYCNKHQDTSYKTSYDIRKLTEISRYYGGGRATTSLLTTETINILVKLIKKRTFLLKNPTFLT
jgi:hypothetical protein